MPPASGRSAFDIYLFLSRSRRKLYFVLRSEAVSGSLVQRNKVVAKRKGAVAAATAVGGAVAVVAGAPVIGALGLAGAAYLAWDWFSFRVKNGMRF
jgi:hypothetical protein